MTPGTRRALAVTSLVLAAAVVGLVILGRTTDPELEAPRLAIPVAERSILLLTVDTTNPEHLQPYGAEDVATPVLQRLAEGGILFENAVAVSPLTLVSHTSIHSGLYPPRHGVRNNGLHYVPDEVETLAERLSDRGWRTAAFVSAAVLERRYNLHQGFEVYDDDLSTGRERLPRMVPDRPAEVTVDAAASWLQTVPAGERFFLWVHLYDPHAAYNPPPPYRDTYRERLYDGEIAYMDAQIGRLLEHPRLATEDDLAVVVIGDHGESLGEHGEQTHGILAYDSTLAVPFLMVVPDGPRGVRVARPVSQVDLVPTLLDLVGQPRPPDLDGRSLLRPDGDDSRPLYSESYLPYYTYGWSKLHVVRRDGLKYIDGPDPELYDTVRDPRELTDLVEERGNQLHDLRRDLAELEASFGEVDRETSLAIDSEAAERLRSLGYLSVGGGPPSPADGERPDPKSMVGLHVGLERARMLAANRLHDQAIRQLGEVLQLDPANLAALIDLAGQLQLTGDLDRAEEVARRALELEPGYPRLHLVLAAIEGQRGEIEGALALVDAALAIDPNMVEASIRKAMLLQRAGRAEESRAALEAGLDRDPDSPPLNVAYARLVEERAGDLAAAEARLRSALKRDPFLAQGWEGLGAMLERTGRLDEALVSYREGLRRHPDAGELHAACGLLLARRGAAPAAIAHLREAIRLIESFRSELHVALGGLLAEAGQVQDAQDQYRLVLERDPDNAPARNNHAIALYRSGQAEEAEAELRAILAQHPRYGDAFNNLAAICLDGERWTEAERAARRATELVPRSAQAWNNLGVALDELGRLEEARAGLERALTLEEGYWEARLNLGICLRKLGRAEEATAVLERVIEQSPGQPLAHLELADLYTGRGDGARARQHYNAFLRAAPGHPRAAEVRRRLSGLPPG